MQQVTLIKTKPRNLAYLGLTVNLLQSTLAPLPVGAQVTNLPPPARKGIIVISDSSPQEDASTSFNQTQIYQLPQPRRVGIITTIRTVPQEDAETPANVLEWRNPLRPNPDIRNKSWINNNLLDTLSISSTPGQSSSVIQFGKKQNDTTWIQNRPIFAVDEQPHNQKNWPNPILPKKLNPSWKEERDFYPVPLEPNFLPIAYPNPLYKGRLRPEFVKLPAFIQLETIFPDGARFYDNPVRRIKPKPQDHIQEKPQYYTEPASVILFTQIYDLPPRRAKRLVVRSNTRFPQPASTAKPFNEAMQWPNPVLRPKRAIPWVDYYIFDEERPPVGIITNVPLRKRISDTSYIQTSRIQVISSADPFVPYNYPNPIIIKRATLSEINNLLQHPFAIAPGDVPFFENNHPNPIIGLKIHHQGWQWDKRFYYTEEPLQPAQYDWPIFRAVNRNQVGFINYQFAPPSDNPFVSITNVPLVKARVGITFADNPIIRIFPPVEIILPFNQTSWPNPRTRAQINKDIIDWLDQYYPILPQIIGRQICLNADITEYELLAEIEEHEYLALITIYDLPAGGTECQ